MFQRQREKRASEGGAEHTTPAEQAPASEPVDLGRQIPWQDGDSPPVNRFPQHGNTFPQNTTVKCPDADPVSTVERGRDYARKQTAKRMERTRQIQNRMGQSGGPRQIDAGSATTAHRQTESAINMTKQPAQPMRRARERNREQRKDRHQERPADGQKRAAYRQDRSARNQNHCQNHKSGSSGRTENSASHRQGRESNSPRSSHCGKDHRCRRKKHCRPQRRRRLRL